MLLVGLVVEDGGGFALDPAVIDSLQGGKAGPGDPLCRILSNVSNFHSVLKKKKLLLDLVGPGVWCSVSM